MSGAASRQSPAFRDEVIEGLSRAEKSIPPKYLYDGRGSELFERICETPEYYVTRTETAILAENASEVAAIIGEDAAIIELGSGASRKTRILLDALRAPAAYVPVDISREALLAASARLRAAYPSLPIIPVCADFTLPSTLPESELPTHTRRMLVFFPGSTIGNFEPPAALRFLRATAGSLGAGGRLLVGVDLLKARSALESAYDDAGGVTARFNLNLLYRMRRELEAEVDPEGFRHLALFNDDEGRIEMHLVSLREQTLSLPGHRFRFEQGDTIHTESSYKYSPAQFKALASLAGLECEAFWTDPKEWFGVALLSCEL